MKYIKRFFVVLSILVSIWFVASYIDIVADNCNPNPQHAKWNMFSNLIDEYYEYIS